MRQRVRMKDIADYLSISPSTVSRALNPEESSRISPEVVAKIKKTATKMGYVSDIAAASLRTQKTFTIGMIVPDILNPVFPPIVQGAQQYLTKKGYVTFVLYSENDQEVAKQEILRLIGRRVDGILFASAFLEDQAVEYCLTEGTPLVLVNRSIIESNRVHQVLDNDAYGIELAITHLMQLGHSKLIHLAGPQNILQGAERLHSFIQQCEYKKLDYEVVKLDSFTLESGMRAVQEIIKRKLTGTAIVAGNDLIAIGAIQALKAAGKKIPQDYSVVGFNGMPLAECISPALTTIVIPHKALGESAAKLIVDEIENPDGPRQKILLTPELVIRESTAEYQE